MKIIHLLLASCFLLHGSLFAAGKTPAKPNIIFILADDLGWADLGCYGSTFHETPNLDKLAAQGMRFTDAYAACFVCSPTRASIMTGKYPARLHLTDYFGAPPVRNQKLIPPGIQQFLPLEEFTVAEALKAGGYKTGFIGKWHLGEDPKYFPDHQGFDVNIAGCGMGHPNTYFSPYRIPNLEDRALRSQERPWRAHRSCGENAGQSRRTPQGIGGLACIGQRANADSQ